MYSLLIRPPTIATAPQKLSGRRTGRLQPRANLVDVINRGVLFLDCEKVPLR
jgi:hypothetical protein